MSVRPGALAEARMKSITILVPVLGRAHAIKPLVDSIFETTLAPGRLLFLCSPGDSEANSVCFEYAVTQPKIFQFIVPWEPGPGDWARKINRGFEITQGEFVLLGATDLKFHSGWDSAALHVANETGAGVIGTNDMGNATVMRGHHSTHPLVRRSYIERCGTIDEEGKVVHEGYQHQWVDTELCETAKARGEWAFARDSLVEHMHPFWNRPGGGKKAEMDATYEKALSTPREDSHLFSQRRAMWQPSGSRSRISVS